MYRLLRPFLFSLPAETAHQAAFATLRAAGPLAVLAARKALGAPDPRLALEVAGLRFAAPVGLAAGLDKDGVLAPFWPALGFGFVELGTVTALAQPGNPKPRLFRLPEQRALINRMGFNNRGSLALARRLRELSERVGPSPVPLGVNIGKSKVTPLVDAARDYALSAERLAPLCDYLAINVSSPNTPGLRELQDAAALGEIVEAVREQACGRPVFVKLAPDLTFEALDQAVEVAQRCGAAGLIATNTTIDRTGLPPAALELGDGGLSGRPLAARALEVIAYLAQRTELPVIGVGGIDSADGVLAAIRAGAAAVELYTAFIYGGPTLIAQINAQLARRLDSGGCRDLRELAADTA